MTPTAAAKKVLTENWNGQLPIDPVTLAEKMGFVVTPVRADYSGRAYQSGNTRYIEYNESESALRQRFTIAHELGHHLLAHADSTHQFRDDPSKFNLNVTIPEETQANKFAAELLMPRLAIEHFLFKENISSLAELAKRFSVSAVAMRFRLKNLGLL